MEMSEQATGTVRVLAPPARIDLGGIQVPLCLRQDVQDQLALGRDPLPRHPQAAFGNECPIVHLCVTAVPAASLFQSISHVTAIAIHLHLLTV